MVSGVEVKLGSHSEKQTNASNTEKTQIQAEMSESEAIQTVVNQAATAVVRC